MKVYVTVWYRDLRNERIASELASLGLDGIELSLDYPLCSKLRVDEVDQLGRAIDLGLEVGIHLPWREIYLASPLYDVRDLSKRYVISCLRESSRIEPKYAVVHVTTDQAACMDDVNECVRAAEDSVSTIAKVAEDVGIPIYVETTRSYCCGGLEQLVKFLNYGIKVCLDVPHAIERYSRFYRRLLTIEDVINEAPPALLRHIDLVHLHGYNVSGYRIVDSHMIPSPELVSKYVSLVRRGALKPTYTVLEVFYLEPGKRIEVANLKWVVNELK